MCKWWVMTLNPRRWHLDKRIEGFLLDDIVFFVVVKLGLKV
jgi:hypothetical protein